MTTITGFNGVFGPANWGQSTGVPNFNSPNDTILTIILTDPGNIQTGLYTTYQTLLQLPKGKISFTYSLDDTTGTQALYRANGGSSINLPVGSGSVSNIQINNNGTFYFSLSTESNVTLQISNWQFQYDQEEYPCFNEGSKILCLKDNKEDYLPIENLKKGDLVKTYKHGFQRIEMIGKRKMCNLSSIKKEDRMHRLSKKNYPELIEDLYITGFHAILVNDLTDEQIEKTKEIMNILYKTDDKYRLIASLDDRAEKITDNKEYTIYHFSLEHDDIFMNYGVYANGLLVESNSLRNMKEYSGMEYF